MRPLLRRAAASHYLLERFGVERAPATLAKYAVRGGGPKFHKVGRAPIYDPAELDRWVAALIGRPIASTSEAPDAPEGAKERRTRPALPDRTP